MPRSAADFLADLAGAELLPAGGVAVVVAHADDETIGLYKLWWFKPFEVALVGAVLFHALNGLRIILFDFWPSLALRQKTFAYVELLLFVAGFAPAAFFMLRSAYETSPFA